MKELTMEEKMTLLIEINSLLATIPDYQLAMSESEMEYYHIFITDKGYIDRLYLEYGEISDKFLGKTRKEAIQSLHVWRRPLRSKTLLVLGEETLSDRQV